MATTEAPQYSHDRSERPGRRRPFSSWMKRLTNFKNGSSTANPNGAAGLKRNTYQMRPSAKKQHSSKNNNPYPESGRINGNFGGQVNGHRSFSTVPTGTSISRSSIERSRHSIPLSEDGHSPPTIGNKSTAPTTSTDVEHSDAPRSHAASSGDGTTATAGYGVSSGQGADSTFSSPAPSVRSLTTTLTTIQSTAAPAPPSSSHNHTSGHNTQSIQFSHQFPTSPPPTALPAHLAPQGSGGHPATYSTATANNLLTDNASILTLASSSKRRRRRSMDTDASVRAMAPSSLFGGSRESLPLSVLSSNIESTSVPPAPHQARPSVGGLNERASIYSATGVAPALPSERNSYYAGKQSIAADGGSVKSGLLGHGRTDSITGSIGGLAASGSPLASPRDGTAGKVSCTNSAWGETDENEKGVADTEGDGKEFKDNKDVS